MITLVTGDLFTTPDLDALAQGVNCDGKMGKGIVVEFKKRWPRMFDEYARLCAGQALFPGNIFSYRALDESQWIYGLATQWKPGPCATLNAVWASTRALVRSAKERGIRRVGMPRVGCGLGGLAWEDVLPLLTRAAEGSTVELVVVSLPEVVQDEEDLKQVATEVNARIASNPEAWFWCLHCERVCQAKELKEDFLGAMSMCPHGNCGACGIGIDIYEIRPDGTVWGFSGPVHGPGKGPALDTLSSGQVVSLN